MQFACHEKPPISPSLAPIPFILEGIACVSWIKWRGTTCTQRQQVTINHLQYLFIHNSPTGINFTYTRWFSLVR